MYIVIYVTSKFYVYSYLCYDQVLCIQLFMLRLGFMYIVIYVTITFYVYCYMLVIYVTLLMLRLRYVYSYLCYE